MKASRLIAFTLMSAPILVPVAALASPDAEFLTDAMKGDNSEVAMGKMAIQHSHSAQTRAYGEISDLMDLCATQTPTPRGIAFEL